MCVSCVTRERVIAHMGMRHGTREYVRCGGFMADTCVTIHGQYVSHKCTSTPNYDPL